MGVPIDFQYILNNSIEILLSIIVIIVASYYLFLKGKISSQPKEYTRRWLTLYQQTRLETNQHQKLSTSKWDAASGQQSTDDTSFGVPEQMAAVSQVNTMEKNSTRLSVGKSAYVMEKVATIPDTSLETHSNDWSETEKIDKTTADLDVSTTTTTTTTGLNQNIDLSQPIITATTHMENQQQDAIDDDANENQKHHPRNTDDQFQTSNDDINDDDEKCATLVGMDMPMEPSEQQINTIPNMTDTMEYANHHPEPPMPTIRMDDNDDMKNMVDNNLPPMDDDDNKSVMPLDQMKTPPSSTQEKNHATNTISATDPKIGKCKSQQHANNDNSATTHHVKVNAASFHLLPPPSYTDNKPKQDMTKLERIDQQRQPYIALYKSRCEFWPGCTNNHCKYYHPFTECRNGNACKFGNKCVFLHPKDYLDHRYLKQTNQTKQKTKGKNKTKLKVTGDKLQANQAKPSKQARKKAVE